MAAAGLDLNCGCFMICVNLFDSWNSVTLRPFRRVVRRCARVTGSALVFDEELLASVDMSASSNSPRFPTTTVLSFAFFRFASASASCVSDSSARAAVTTADQRDTSCRGRNTRIQVMSPAASREHTRVRARAGSLRHLHGMIVGRHPVLRHSLCTKVVRLVIRCAFLLARAPLPPDRFGTPCGELAALLECPRRRDAAPPRCFFTRPMMTRLPQHRRRRMQSWPAQAYAILDGRSAVEVDAKRNLACELPVCLILV